MSAAAVVVAALVVDTFDAVTSLIRQGLRYLVIPPIYYHGLLPDNHLISLEMLEGFISSGHFKTLPDLAPAFTYMIILSLVRYVLHLFIFKVSERYSLLCIHQ